MLLSLGTTALHGNINTGIYTINAQYNSDENSPDLFYCVLNGNTTVTVYALHPTIEACYNNSAIIYADDKLNSIALSGTYSDVAGGSGSPYYIWRDSPPNWTVADVCS